MTPIEKNIAVTDESGKQYEPTYWKRAKGLVKHDRARWVDEEKICLTCPPEQIEAEDITMDEKVYNNIKEQIEFLKADLNREVPLNMGSEFQPEAACKIAEARELTKQQILQLMSRLSGTEPQQDEKQYYRQLLEKIVTDHSAIDMVKEAISEMDDDDVKQQTIGNAVDEYEISKREIAEKILAKLG